MLRPTLTLLPFSGPPAVREHSAVLTEQRGGEADTFIGTMLTARIVIPGTNGVRERAFSVAESAACRIVQNLEPNPQGGLL